MTKPVSEASLILYPEDTLWLPEQSGSTINILQQLAFIGESIKDKKHSFYVGDKFLEQIAFMGCAPHIEFVASEDNPKFCFIHIISLSKPKLFHSTKQARAPHCPACNKAEKNWQQAVAAQSVTEQADIYCHQCQTTSPIETFNWRKSAGYAQFFIEICDIYPREAIPQASFLEGLKDLHETNWQYFYYCR